MLRKANFIMILTLFPFLNIFSQNEDLPPLVTVNRVDLNKYVGLWYEIAKIPNSFQNQCAYGTTAEYKLLEDSEIQVINKCYKSDGEQDVAEGLAKVVDKKTNSKLEVSFFSIFGFRPFWGDYWIIELDDNYQWVVVGSPDRKYGWILSRTTTLSDDKMQKIFALLKAQNYNPDKFEMTLHKSN
jgi:apolipoprotein D and lipocalin family protein